MSLCLASQKPSEREFFVPAGTDLGCDFFESVGEKRIDIRRMLGYVCQIAKVRVRMSFGWVSLFTQKYVFFISLCIFAYRHKK